jgi:hypothetical protein
MQPISRSVPGALADLMRAAPLSSGKVEFAWSTVVGPALRRVTSVRLEGTQLIVDADSPQWGREIARGVPLILPRLQTFLGRETVTRIAVRHRP